MVKKILLLFIILFLLSTPQVYATERVIDMQSKDYYRTASRIFTSVSEKYRAECSELSRGGLPTTQTFFVYKNGESVQIWLGEDKYGYVQYILEVGQYNDSLPNITAAILMTSAGIQPEEMSNGEIIKEEAVNVVKKIWVNKLNRYVLLEMKATEKGYITFAILPENLTTADIFIYKPRS